MKLAPDTTICRYGKQASKPSSYGNHSTWTAPTIHGRTSSEQWQKNTITTTTRWSKNSQAIKPFNITHSPFLTVEPTLPANTSDNTACYWGSNNGHLIGKTCT